MMKLDNPLLLSSLAASCESLSPKRTAANCLEGKENKEMFFQYSKLWVV